MYLIAAVGLHLVLQTHFTKKKKKKRDFSIIISAVSLIYKSYFLYSLFIDSIDKNLSIIYNVCRFCIVDLLVVVHVFHDLGEELFLAFRSL